MDDSRRYYGKHDIGKLVTTEISGDDKLDGDWYATIKPSLWHWSSALGWFKTRWWHYLLPPWLPPRDTTAVAALQYWHRHAWRQY